ncbi:RNA polymerase sigma factor [Longispora urticae]
MEALDQVWRADAPRIRAALARRLGDLDAAEDALQEAVAAALDHWPADGVPVNPGGWLLTTAWRRAVDRLRREARGRELLARVADVDQAEDDRLGLLFGCCDPVLPTEAQIALTLRAVGGLATAEVAAAFLVPETTMAQRLTRARRTLKNRPSPFVVPDPERLAERLDGVLHVLYLVFNEGYQSRPPLRAEALRLTRELADLMPGEPEAAGLAALMELHEARAATRFDAAGELVVLDDQDRSRWDGALIGAALRRLRRAVALCRTGVYQLQAGIAAQHALAPTAGDTDWRAIRALYDRLHALRPDPVTWLSRAVATWRLHGPERALAEVEEVADRLGHYRLLHATRAELLAALGRDEEAGRAARTAHDLAVDPAERRLLDARLRASR